MDKYTVRGYTPTVGIECHVQLKTDTKLFSEMSNNARNADPNSLVDHICFGLPGALPVLNKQAVALAARAAFALGTTPQRFSKFDRKHYFYPDLPKGYQISQFDEPIILNGAIEIRLEGGERKLIRITRAHLEEDAGKSTHQIGTDYSLVDLNRAGTPLLEIVSEPDIHSAAEARAYAKELWLRMKFADVSDVDLFHGNMRFDVNVSVSKDDHLGTRTETKNLNSFRNVEKAVAYEINRQIDVLESGGEIVQETRGWLDDAQQTVSQRSKEEAHDYRYFPDPDIPPIVLDDHFIERVRVSVPVMPDKWRERLAQADIDPVMIETLLDAQAAFDADYLGLVADSLQGRSKQYTNWIVNIEVPLQKTLVEKGKTITINDTMRQRIYDEVYDLTAAGKLNSNNAKTLIEQLLGSDELPESIEEYANSKGYIQLTDMSAIEDIVDQVIAKNEKAANDVRNGEMKAIGFLVGQVMKLSAGAANPGAVQKMLREKLQ